jgi:hypothetical protein
LATAIALIGSGLIFATVPMNRRWPDYLAHRLRDAGGETRFMSVINAGISKAINSHVLRDSPRRGEEQE